MEVVAYPIYYKIKEDEDGTVKLKVYMYDIKEKRFISAYYRRHKPFLVVREADLPRAKKIIAKSRFEGVLRLARDPREGYARIYVKSPTLIPKLRGILNVEGVETYEDDIKYLMRVMIDGVIPAKPLRVLLSNVERKEDERGELLRGDILYMEPVNEELILGSVPVVSFDIELAHPREVFPRPGEYPVFLISLAMAEGDEVRYFSLVNASAFEDKFLESQAGKSMRLPYRDGEAEVIFFEDEREMLIEFARIMARNRVLVITGYNSDSFDWFYILERSKRLGIYYDMVRLLSAAFDDEDIKVVEYDEKDPSFTMIRPQSVKEKVIFIPGRLNVDIFQLIRLPMFKPIVGNITPLTLKNVAAELGILPTEERVMIDLKATDMETEWKKDWKRALTYNLDDAYAALKLTFSFLSQMIVLSQITNIPPQFIVKWSNSKILTVLFGIESINEGILIPKAPGRREEEKEQRKGGREVKYRGAFVIHPDPSIVEGLVILDFQSLYPNIIVNFNIGTDSIIGTIKKAEERDGKLVVVVEADGEERTVQLNPREHNVVPFLYHVFYTAEARESFVRKVVYKLLVSRLKYKYTAKKLKKIVESLEGSEKDPETLIKEFLNSSPSKYGENEVVKEITEKLLEKYGDNREMLTKELSVQAELMDRRQTAYKFLLNSSYGVLGFTNFRWYEKRSAESITAYGRWLIMRTKEFLEKVGFYVVSGDTDSVMITLKENVLYQRTSEEARRAREQYVKEYEEAKKYIQATFGPYISAEGYLLFRPVEDLVPLWKKYLVERLRSEGMEASDDEPLESLYKKKDFTTVAIWAGEFCTEYLYRPFRFVLEFDKYFDKAVFLMAKNYAAMTKGKLKLKGIEAKKRNFSRIARDEQLFLLNLIFDLFDFFKSLRSGEPDPSLIPDTYVELKEMIRDVEGWEDFTERLLQFLDKRMHNIIKGILAGDYPIEMFVRYTELGKNLHEYDSKGSAGVYAAEAEMREFPEVKYVRGDRIPWVYALDPDLLGKKKVTKSMFARTVRHVLKKNMKIYPMPYIEEIAGRYDKILYIFDRYTNPAKFMKLINGTAMNTLEAFFEEVPQGDARQDPKKATLLDFIDMEGERETEKRKVTLEDYF